MGIWDGISNNTRRRTDSCKDIFYVKTKDGYPALEIETEEETHLYKNKKFNLEKIEMRIQGQNLFIILTDKNMEQIFGYVCTDIINSINELREENILRTVEKRLSEWKDTFRDKENKAMSEIQQMGLFTELFFFKNTVLKLLSPKAAIYTWKGPEKDKQDFIFEKCAVEIKSHKSSKSNEVSISSAEQLVTLKKKLYLVSYTLSIHKNGQTVKELFEEIMEYIKNNNPGVEEIFKIKVIKYGYIFYSENEDLKMYIVDKREDYYVNEDFPKIIPGMLMPGIKEVKYKVDLALCEQIPKEILELEVR